MLGYSLAFSRARSVHLDRNLMNVAHDRPANDKGRPTCVERPLALIAALR
jgi:hypothetical protein